MSLRKFFIIALILIVSFLLLGNKDMTLKVAFPVDSKSSQYEPTRIHLAPEYIFLENIFSTLFEFNKDGELVGGIAQRFYWDKSRLYIQLRQNIKTIDGHIINADDVILSLKRLLILSSNTHGNFKTLVCNDYSLESLDDNCPGLEKLNDYELIINASKHSDFLVPMLTALDFAIIPKNSFDHKTLAIVDYRNTSGPYFVANDDEAGNIELEANKSHYHYSEEMPQKIKLVPAKTYGESLRLLKEGRVDHITTVDNVTSQDLITFFNSNRNDFSLHSTMNIRTVVLNFTSAGIKKYSENQRSYIAEKLKFRLREYYLKQPGYKEVDQFLIGEGALSKEELQEIAASNLKFLNLDHDLSQLTVGILRLGNLDIFQDIFKTDIAKENIFEIQDNPNFGDVELDRIPDIFISGPDVSYKEDIGLISYSINSGDFCISKGKGEKWLKDYMEIPNKSDRIPLLHKLHLESIQKKSVIPVVSGPYVAIANQKWTMNLSPLYANNQLWLFRRK